jgi:hypothetical protein
MEMKKSDVTIGRQRELIELSDDVLSSTTIRCRHCGEALHPDCEVYAYSACVKIECLKCEKITTISLDKLYKLAANSGD